MISISLVSPECTSTSLVTLLISGRFFNNIVPVPLTGFVVIVFSVGFKSSNKSSDKSLLGITCSNNGLFLVTSSLNPLNFNSLVIESSSSAFLLD